MRHETLPYEYLKDAFKNMITIGYNDSMVEVLRDFNGWSWDIVTNEIESLEYNVLYQSMLLLYGNKMLKEDSDYSCNQKANHQNYSFHHITSSLCDI